MFWAETLCYGYVYVKIRLEKMLCYGDVLGRHVVFGGVLEYAGALCFERVEKEIHC